MKITQRLLFAGVIITWMLSSACAVFGPPADCISKNCFCEERVEVTVMQAGSVVGRTWVEQDCPQPMLKRGPRMIEEYVE